MSPLEKEAKQYATLAVSGYSSNIPLLEAHDLIMRAYMDGVCSSQGVEQKPEKFLNEVKEILDHLSEKTGRNFRMSKNNSKIIAARLKEEDVTIDGVKKMIDRQCEKWIGTEYEEYLQPSTLFRPSKFDSYYTARDLPAKPGQPKKRASHLIYGDD